MREREDDLNLKLTDYLLKMEEMTRQLGDLQSKHIRSEHYCIVNPFVIDTFGD